MVIVEFYKTDVGGVEHVTESLRMPRFADRQSFVLWAQIALPSRRNGPRLKNGQKRFVQSIKAGMNYFDRVSWINRELENP